MKENVPMKTAELTGAQLDYWVAKAEGFEALAGYPYPIPTWKTPHGNLRRPEWKPSELWAHGGPIIERERIAVFSSDNGKTWGAEMRQHEEHWIDTTIYDCDAQGPAPLIAAMRAYVASKFGDEVEDK
jgi:hypothetical protein